MAEFPALLEKLEEASQPMQNFLNVNLSKN